MRNYYVAVLIAALFCSSEVKAADSPTALNRQNCTRLANVELGPRGTFSGVVLNATGQPVQFAPLQLLTHKNVIRLSTDDHGRFQVSGLKTGICMLDVGEHSFACRLWTQRQAPPGSLPSVALVAADRIVRGQNDCPPKKRRLHRLTSDQRYGLFITGLVGTAAYFALDRDSS